MFKPLTDAQLRALVGRRVIYKPFDTQPEKAHIGTVERAKNTRFGVEVFVQPDVKTGASLIGRWRSLKGDVIRVMTPIEKTA